MFQPFRAVIAAAALSSILPNCGYVAQQEASRAAEAEIGECVRLYPNQTQRPVTPRVKCIWDARMKYARAGLEHGYHNADLDELAQARVLLLAQSYDAGQITEAQYHVQLAETMVNHNTQAMHRNNGAAMAAAAQQEAEAATSMALSASKPVTCTRTSSVATCY